MAQTLIPSLANFVKPSRVVATLSFASMALRISLGIVFVCLFCLRYYLPNSKSRRTPMLLNSTPVSSRTIRSLLTTIAASAPMQGPHGVHTRTWNKFWKTRLISASLGISIHYPALFPAASHFFFLKELRESHSCGLSLAVRLLCRWRQDIPFW